VRVEVLRLGDRGGRERQREDDENQAAQAHGISLDALRPGRTWRGENANDEWEREWK
jgi:hypothetical protein